MSQNILKINKNTLNTQYTGAGLAMVAVVGVEVVAIRYIADIDDELGGIIDEYAEANLQPTALLKTWMQTPQAGAVVRELQALGQVSIGMCSCCEFVEM